MNENNWCLAFHRNFFDWRVPGLALLWHDLEKITLDLEVSDNIVWTRQTNGQYSDNSCYRELNKEGGSKESWPWK